MYCGNDISIPSPTIRFLNSAPGQRPLSISVNNHKSTSCPVDPAPTSLRIDCYDNINNGHPLNHITSPYHQPTTHNQQPTTHNQQPTTNNQQPTTNNQQPTTTQMRPTTPTPFSTLLITALLLLTFCTVTLANKDKNYKPTCGAPFCARAAAAVKGVGGSRTAYEGGDASVEEGEKGGRG
ncbi:hypothetical protein BDW02DRAFT_575887 [Decorospora gaudefroyi]|uniref:Uncharacterized protein n=1 Tax=Decorospora gaudefroyi TaxID=184978 RepID=A0A6A5KRT1_9PLEO|nr:hypothetical protein BDW02DRAFT_575887 [Decorospora gaudefroyi]